MGRKKCEKQWEAGIANWKSQFGLAQVSSTFQWLPKGFKVPPTFPPGCRESHSHRVMPYLEVYEANLGE